MATIKLRTVEGRALTNQEVDDNFTNINNGLLSLTTVVNEGLVTVLNNAENYTDAGLVLKQDKSDILTSVSSLSSSGIIARTGSGTTATRTITSGSALISVTNGDGVIANPIITLDSTVLTTSNVKTITNKSIDGNDNTITNISIASFNGVTPISKGGTNADNAAAARINLGIMPEPAGAGIVVKLGANSSIARTFAISGIGLSLTNANGTSGNPTITSNANSDNGSSTLVARDASGNFAAGLISADLHGNASTVSNGLYSTGLYSNPSWLVSLAGSKITNIPNSSLTNSSVTINGSTVALGGSITITSSSLGISTDYLHLTGGTLTGKLTLDGNPVNSLHAATKGYVDSLSSTYLPIAGGTLTGKLILNANPTDNYQATTKQYVDSAVGGINIGSYLLKTGGILTGKLTLDGSPINTLHAATKGYVDTSIAAISSSTVYTFTSGSAIYNPSYSNEIGSFNDDANKIDVFPPSGKTMANFVAFLPSVAFIYFAGQVDANDALRCTYSVLSDRIRVFTQNTEQRYNAATNYIAIWSN